jgi:arsenate reductase
MKARIYHNPRCSKSRAALALLNERGVAVEIVDYIAAPPPRAELAALLQKLGVAPLEMIRRDDPEIAKRAAQSPERVLDLLVEHPRALQRPIVEVGARAVIGRPPERVLELLE